MGSGEGLRVVGRGLCSAQRAGGLDELGAALGGERGADLLQLGLLLLLGACGLARLGHEAHLARVRARARARVSVTARVRVRVKVGVRVRARASRLGPEAHRGAVAVLQHVLVEQLDEDLVAASGDLILQPAEVRVRVRFANPNPNPNPDPNVYPNPNPNLTLF